MLFTFGLYSRVQEANAMIDRARLEELREEVGNDDFAEVIELFCEEVAETLDRMAQGHSSSMADDLHFLKGSALNIGMSEVASLCAAVEAMIRDNGAASPNIGGIKTAFDKAQVELMRQP